MSNRKPCFVTGTGVVMVYAPDHPSAYDSKYYPEHRIVMEAKLGRYLLPKEIVKHKNGDISDNSPSNLELSKHKTRRIHKGGYIQIYEPKNPNSDSSGWIMEHRAVMAKHIGRPLKPEEIVHHKDEVKWNNSISNLELLPNISAHMKIHQPKKSCKLCGKFKVVAHGLCSAHYKAQNYKEKKYFARCAGCNKPVPKRNIAKDGKVLCRGCRFPKTWCILCDQPARGKKMCKKHYAQWLYCRAKGLTYDAFKRWLSERKRMSKDAANSTPAFDY